MLTPHNIPPPTPPPPPLPLPPPLRPGTKAEKIQLKKWYTIFKDHITLSDYEIKDGMNLELYYT
jgi:hypothetical protein